MAKVIPGRFTAQTDEAFVVFMIGMRVNNFFAFRKWIPTAIAMGPMLRTLFQHPEKGMLGAQTFFYWPGIALVEYWRSFDELEKFARDKDDPHLGAWRRFNKHIGSDGSVGIFHETFHGSLSGKDAFPPAHGSVRFPLMEGKAVYILLKLLKEENVMDPIRIFPIISWILLPTVMYGGYSLLGLTVRKNSFLTDFREKYFRAGHAHAGVLLVMSLVYYIFLGQTTFPSGLRLLLCIVLLVGILAQSGGFFLHMMVGQPERSSTGTLITTLGAVLLVFSTLFLAYGLAVAHI